MRKALGAQMGRNAEAYVDDIIIKTRKSHTFIEDLEETFANLRKGKYQAQPRQVRLWRIVEKVVGVPRVSSRDRGEP
jgi:hypothetical protein